MMLVRPRSSSTIAPRLWLFVAYQTAFLSILFSYLQVQSTGVSSPPTSAMSLLSYATIDRNVFIENRGQFADGLAAVMFAQEAQLGIGYDGRLHLMFDDLPPIVLTFTSEGYISHASVTFIRPLKTKVSFLYGNDPEKWQSDVPVWESVRITGLLPHVAIELAVEANRLRLKAIPDNTIPDPDLHKIKLLVSNAEVVGIVDSELEVQTGNQRLYLPLLEIHGRNATSFRATPIVIDPHAVSTPFVYPTITKKFKTSTSTKIAQILAESTFLGGRMEKNSDIATVMSLDSQNNVVLAGETRSPNFPTTPIAYDTTFNGRSDAIIVKLSNDLRTLLAATFLGGYGEETITALTFDSHNNIIVAGNTNSPNFPTTSGAYDMSYNGRNDVFLAKLNSELSILHAATLLGGLRSDDAFSLTLDRKDNVFVAGYTWSLDFPITAGAYDSTPDIRSDAFVAQLSSDLTKLVAATFLGGSRLDLVTKLLLDDQGNVVITGQTQSPDFPTTSGAYDTTHNGLHDGFVAKLSNDLTILKGATLLGGSYDEFLTSLALDTQGNVIVAGSTTSPDFPTTSGAYDTTHNGLYDGFVAKLSNDLTILKGTTLIGGSYDEFLTSLALDTQGNVIVAGSTTSPDFPTTSGAYDTIHNGKADVFVVKLSNTLNTLENATFLGGTLSDNPTALALDLRGNIFVAGWTISPDFPTTVKAYDRTYNGDADIFVAKLTLTSRRQMVPLSKVYRVCNLYLS